MIFGSSRHVGGCCLVFSPTLLHARCVTIFRNQTHPCVKYIMVGICHAFMIIFRNQTNDWCEFLWGKHSMHMKVRMRKRVYLVAVVPALVRLRERSAWRSALLLLHAALMLRRCDHETEGLQRGCETERKMNKQRRLNVSNDV